MAAANSIISVTGKTFVVDDSNRETLSTLAEYFSNQSTSTLDRKKGVMLLGVVGCGKTIMLEAYRRIAPKSMTFGMKSTPIVAREFFEDGPAAMRYYMSPYKKDSNALNHYGFDDLGTEDNKKFYGNEANVMADIIYCRYELWIKHGVRSYFTTNKNVEELKEAYGDRVYSRLAEMCNWVVVEGKDRRQL